MKKRIMCIVLCLCMLAAEGCSTATVSDNTTNDTTETETTDAVTADTAEAVEETEDEAVLPSNVPEDLDFNGESLVLYYYKCLEDYNVEQEELTGENVVDAIYNSNHNVMDYLNCKFEYYNDSSMEMTNIINSVSAGDGSYDICYVTQWKVAQVLTKHYLMDFQNDQYMNFDDPWWYKDYMVESSTGSGQVYMLAGDLNPTVIRRASEMLMNTDLLRDMNISSDDVKTAVLEGRWTYDMLQTISSSIYVDVNGNGEADYDDTYGISSNTASDVEHLLIDSGVRVTERNEENIPVDVFNSERTISSVEKMYNLFWNNTGMYYVEGIDRVTMLGQNRVAFLMIKFSDLETFRDVDTDFTVIPDPKTDETVESYSSLVHDDVTVVTEPVTSNNPQLVSAVIEQLCYDGYYNVIPEYYNVSLKNKYTRNMDDDNVKIIDMIHDNITTEFAYVYNYVMSDTMLGLRTLICTTKSSDFASYYAKKQKVFNKSLEKLIKNMAEE